MQVSVKVSRCPSCNAVTNPRWGECLACGEAFTETAPRTALPKEPATPIPPARETTETKWDSFTAEIIEWFLTSTPPATPFLLTDGVTVADPARWWASIKADIAAGPGGPRSGVLASDLRAVHALFSEGDADG